MSKYLNDHPDDDRKTVTEDCPTCGNEVTMVWDVERNGYKATCPFCGEQLQLVTELSPIETTSGKVISEFRMNYYKHTETDKCPLGYGFVLDASPVEVRKWNTRKEPQHEEEN